jgi:hypothetical protein
MNFPPPKKEIELPWDPAISLLGIQFIPRKGNRYAEETPALRAPLLLPSHLLGHLTAFHQIPYLTVRVTYLLLLCP